jgi:hypothetical protein
LVLFVACAAIIGVSQDSTPKAPPDEKAEEPEDKAEETPAPTPAPAKKDEGQTVTVRVTGTPGVAFQGNYGTPDSTRSVDGVTPQEYDVEVETGLFSTDAVTAVMQKQGQGNEELSVEMLVGDETVKEQSTTSPFGVVTVNLTPPEIQQAA